MNDKEFTWNAFAQGMFLSLSRKMLLCLWFNGQETFSFTLSCISVEYCHFYLVFWGFYWLCDQPQTAIRCTSVLSHLHIDTEAS